MGVLQNDLRWGFRALLKNRAFTAVAVSTLALGIGVNTAVFSLVDNMLFRSPPIARLSELVTIGRRATAHQSAGTGISWPMYLEYRSNCGNTLTGLAAYFARLPVTVSQSGGSRMPVLATVVTDNYFDLLGIRAVQGRTIGPEDNSAATNDDVAVVSYRLWREFTNGRADAVGSILYIDGSPYRIIGVAPSGFFGVNLDSVPDVWLPMSVAARLSPLLRTQMQAVENPFFDVLGRLKPEISIPQARQQFEAMAKRLDAGKSFHINVAMAPSQHSLTDVWEKPLPALESFNYKAGTRSETSSLLLIGTAALILLLVVSDITSLLLARTENRRRELAVRLALGASRGQIVRVVLIEGLILSGFGAAMALFVAHWSVRLLVVTAPPQIRAMLATGTSILDARVLIFTILVSVLSGVGFSLIPALGAARSNVLLAMKNDSPSSSSGRPRAALRGALTVFQIAASVVLLVTTLLFLRTFWNDSRVQLAFDPNHILMVYPRLQGYDAAAEKSFFDNFVESVKTIPGVRAAAVGSPAAPGWSIGMPEGMYYVSRITTDYFSVLNIPILRGRNFNTQDRRGAPYVGVVNERMARKFWPGKDAVGQRLDHVLTGDATVEIVGVVPDTRKEGIGAPEDPTLYLQLDQFYSAYPYRIGSVLLVRSDGDIAALLPGLRGVLNRLDKDVTLSGTQSVGEFLALRFQDIRFLTELLGVFATLAIILAATGLYGLVAYITTARTSEFGLRLALGASQADIVRLVLRHGILRALAGVALGLGLATVLTGFLAGFLHGVKGVDAETFGIVAIILCGVALVASYIPARRASRLAPMAALRQD